MTDATAGQAPTGDPADANRNLGQQTDSLDGTPLILPKVRPLDRGQPWKWLAAGWEDFAAAWQISVVLGGIYVVLGGAILWALFLTDAFYLAAPLAGGFFLVGPVAAVGFYEVSRARAAGETPTLLGALTAWKRNPTQVLFMAVVLLGLYIIWARIAILIFMLFFSGNPPRPEWMFIIDVFFSAQSIPFLATGTAVGGVLAILAFSISAVSIPLLVDRRESNVIVAMAASVEAVRRNPWPMGIWAWLIVLFVGAGLVAGFVGLIVTLPLIGHATWHAYKSTMDFSAIDGPAEPAAAPDAAETAAPAPTAAGSYTPPVEATD